MARAHHQAIKATPAGSNVYDVTKYSASTSASANANSKAFTDVFKAVCASKDEATLLVPPGTYQLGPVTFAGPCPCTHITVEIRRMLLAPPHVESFPGPAWIEFDALHQLVVEGGGVIDGQGQAAWIQDSSNKAISVRLMRVVTGKITNLTFKNSKYFHIALHRSQAITVEKLKIAAPCNSKNTDGVHVSSSNNVILNALDIGTGDDCISIGPGSINVTVTGVRCGPGHGLSIGSLGKYKNEENVGNIHVRNCTVAGTTNGVRIKTWPNGKCTNNSPTNGVRIIIDQEYCPNGKCTNNQPSQVKLSDISFSRIRGTSNTPVAVQLKCSAKVACQNVKLQDINLQPLISIVPKISSICSNVLGAVVGTQQPDPCLGKHAGNSNGNATPGVSSPAQSPEPSDK